MAKRVQLIRHNTGGADAFTGLNGEITVDTTAKELRLHDSLTEGGIPTARKDLANVENATIAIAGKMSAADKVELAAVRTELDAEVIDRIADVDAEEIRALAAEGVLQTNIDNEAITRASEDALLIPLTQKAAALGVATLDAASKVIQEALSAVTLTGLSVSIAQLNDIVMKASTQTITGIKTFINFKATGSPTINGEAAVGFHGVNSPTVVAVTMRSNLTSGWQTIVVDANAKYCQVVADIKSNYNSASGAEEGVIYARKKGLTGNAADKWVVCRSSGGDASRPNSSTGSGMVECDGSGQIEVYGFANNQFIPQHNQIKVNMWFE